MRLINYLCDVVVENKSSDMQILKRFFSSDGWINYDELRDEGKFNYYVIKRLIGDLIKSGVLKEKSFSWKAGTNMHKNGKPITKGKMWKLNNDNKIVKLLRSKIE